MNCKPGDIARITGLPADLSDANDRFVRVVEQTVFFGEIGWTLEEQVVITVRGHLTHGGVRFWPGDKAAFDRIQDKFLRPIRDPGDEAQDETLSWLPSPMAEINAIKRGEVAHG